MKPQNKTTLWQLAIGLIPLIYLLVVFGDLTGEIPMHYDSHGPDRYGSRWELLFVTVFMFVISLGSALLLRNSHLIDPKYKDRQPGTMMLKISWVVVLFISIISVFIIYSTFTFSTKGINIVSGKYVVLSICLLFVILANFMNSIKPSFFVGFRTPWTLSSEENWRRTHFIGARIMFVMGIIIGVLILLLPENFTDLIFMPGTFVIVVIPFIYSYMLYRKENNLKK